MEGTSLVPIFNDQDGNKKILYWEHEGNQAVRRGKWKMVTKYPGSWELYNMEKDRTELNDLTKKHPDLVKKLGDLYKDWSARCCVQSWNQILETRQEKNSKS